MPKYSTLRTFMKRFKIAQSDHALANCPVVIEGDSFFRQCYKNSRCNFILGGEFDRYADFLKTILTRFKESNVTCYVIFNGAMDVDLEKRKVIHKKLIDNRAIIAPGDDNFYDPIFTKDVHRQVLEELGIRYCVTEYDARAVLLDAAKKLHCPVLTSNIEYCLLGMTCIHPDSIVFESAKKQITCKIRTPGSYGEHIRIYDSMKPLFLTVLDENGPLFEKIPEIIRSNPNAPVGPLLHWIRWQKQDEAINKIASVLDTDADRKAFVDSIKKLRKIILHHESYNGTTFQYLIGIKSASNNNKKIPEKKLHELTGKIAGPYINLRNVGIFSGSWVIFDQDKCDAMLATLGIVKYAHRVLCGSSENVTFIGREKNSVSVRLLNMGSKSLRTGSKSDLFKTFVNNELPHFKWNLLETLPTESWLLMIALVYYVSKVNKDFIKASYSILLSYVMLGPVSEKVGLIKKSKIVSVNLDVGDQKTDSICSPKDSLRAAEALMKYFYDQDIKETFDRSILHDLAEFQHCLQHINYLNKLCDEKIMSTDYGKTYNGTFIFNVLIKLKDQDNNPMDFLESHLKASVTVVNFYKVVKDVFDGLLSATLTQ